jgi:hypothetical protein
MPFPDNYADEFVKNVSVENLLSFLDDSDIETKNKDFNSFKECVGKDNICNRYIFDSTDDKVIILIEKLVKCYCLEGINIDEIYKLIKENASFALKRASEWKKSEILMTNDTAEEVKLNCSSAEFRYENKWGYIGESETHEIIYSNKKERVYWVKRKEKDPLCYVFSKNKMYGLKYEHKRLSISKFIGNVLHDNTVETDIGLDEIFAKGVTTVEKSRIELDNHFYKGFFYKGPLWDRNWIEKITIIKSVGFVEGKLRIEIENITYPHNGYVFLDLENGKVLE